MFLESALTIEASALDIASALDHFVREGITEKHFSVTARDTDGIAYQFWIRPLMAQDFMPLADDEQLIKCIANDGKRVDVLLPRPELRESNHHRPLLLIPREATA